MTDGSGTGYLPYPAPIDAYGKGGFRFADMSHRGSILCLPSGIRAWSVRTPDEITEKALAPVFAEVQAISVLLIGAGRGTWKMPDALRLRFHAASITVEVARTGTAVSTYNILLGEGRPVAAALIAAD